MGNIAKQILDDFFSGREHSIKRAYVAITGDKNVTGLLGNCDQMMMREAMGTATFAEALGEAINRRMVVEYQRSGIYDIWRKLVTVSQARSFRAERRVRWGGFGDLPPVAEGDAYVDLDTPGDEEVIFSVGKRGRLVKVTLEAIKNDNVGLIRSIPKKLVEAAKRTLAKFVLNMLRDNVVIHDGSRLFTLGRGNLGVGPLSAVSLSAGRLAISKQKEFGTDDPMWAKARYLVVPMDLEEQSYNLLFNRGPNQDKSFLQSGGLEILPVWYWEDVDDWVLSVDPNEYPSLEIGFLDGKEEPELIVQDTPSVGSVFASDCLTWKINHIYGGTVIDYRGLYKSVVP